MSDLLAIEDLRVRYPDGGQVLAGVNLRVQAGQRIAIIGPNGGGKTTLLLAILRGVVSTGRIRVEGVELTRRTAADVRARCGMTFQDSEDQLFMPTLLEDAAFGPLNQGDGPAQAESKARAAIAAVGLGGLESRSAHHLSGGQKRLAALATILSMDVKLLLLDEPGDGLDFRSRERLVEILRPRAEAMLIATHDLELARKLCSRVVILDSGVVAAEGEVGQILADAGLLARHGLA